MHIILEPKFYDLKIMADLRKFFFKPQIEEQVVEKIKASLWSIFNKHSSDFDPETSGE